MSIRAVLAASVLWVAVSPGAAQQTATYLLEVADPVLAPGESTQVSVLVSFSPGIGRTATQGPLSGSVLGLSRGAFSIWGIGNAGEWSGLMIDPPYAPMPPPVWVGGLNITGLTWDVQVPEPPHPSPNDPDVVWTGTFTAGSSPGTTALSVSADGPVFVLVEEHSGSGLFDATYQCEPGPGAWIIVTECYPDCDLSGALTVADFGCFQSRFVAGDPYADCSGDSLLTVADFGCFQTGFASGCP